MTEPCGTCQSPQRELWPPVNSLPALREVASANWTDRLACPGCGALWMDVPWEPYGQFHYLVRWPRDAEAWCYLRDRDKEASLIHRWHRVRAGQLVPALSSADDLRAIEWHRQRSYGRDPASELERNPQLFPDIEQLLRECPN
jgi:hypothetical protein